MDMFVVPTISFRLLYGLLIMGHGRRHILWFGVAFGGFMLFALAIGFFAAPV